MESAVQLVASPYHWCKVSSLCQDGSKSNEVVYIELLVVLGIFDPLCSVLDSSACGGRSREKELL